MDAADTTETQKETVFGGKIIFKMNILASHGIPS
jgi:hypothetical protein